METNYIYSDIEKIRKDFEEQISRHSALIEAWKAVERQTKKDGSDFAILSKNFKNARLKASVLYGNDLEVFCRVPSSYKYETESISTVHTVEKGEDTTGRQLITGKWLKPYYVLSVDEIFREIEKKIAWHEGIISEYNEALNKLDETFTKFVDSVNSAINTTRPIKPIYYACLDWMHKAY